MKNQQGFTLIETLVYISLFAILIGGAVAVAYSFFESAGHNQAKELLQQEGDFLIGKIEWTLSGIKSVVKPPDATPLNILQVTRYDGSSLTISLNGSNMQLQDALGTYLLNNSNVQVSDLAFTHQAASDGGINPESVSASFTLTARAENGMLISQDFSTTKYLRK